MSGVVEAAEAGRAVNQPQFTPKREKVAAFLRQLTQHGPELDPARVRPLVRLLTDEIPTNREAAKLEELAGLMAADEVAAADAVEWARTGLGIPDAEA